MTTPAPRPPRSWRHVTARGTIRLLVHCYPPSVRRRYGRELINTAVGLWDDDPENALTHRFLRRWSFTVRDLVSAGVAEWLDMLPGRRVRQPSTNRPHHRGENMTAILREIRFAGRWLRKNPAFTVVAALTLGLGIGANTAIFSVVYGVLWRPLGMPNADRLALVYQTREGANRAGTSPTNFAVWRSDSDVFDGIAGYYFESVTLEGDEAEELGSTLVVSANFFDVLGIEPLAGRTFTAGDEIPRQRGNAIILSHALWQRRWAGDRAAIGRTVVVDGRAMEIVGVMPPVVDFPQWPVDAWIPADFDPADRALTRRILAVARVRDGVTMEQAQAQLSGIAVRLGETYPEYRDWDATLFPLYREIVGGTRAALLIVFGSVGLVLLIACANMANLMLARSSARQREIALRAAVGASRGQIIRQVLIESLVVALIGGAVGLGLAVLGHGLLTENAPAIIPRIEDIRIDWPVLGFTALVSVVTGLLFGLAPAMHATAVDVQDGLRGDGSSRGTLSGAARSALVVSQVALAVTLLVGEGLLLRSLLLLNRVDPGFQTASMAAARIYLDGDRYDNDEMELRYYDDLQGRIRALPGVEAVGATSGLPMDPITIDFDSPYELEGQAVDRDQRPRADYRFVTAGYIEAIGIPLLIGRTFTEADRRGTPRVVMVNEQLAAEAWPGENPIGKRLYIFFGGRIANEVVGVVGNTKFRGLAATPRPELYMAHAQAPFSAMTLVVRASGEPAALAPAIRQEALGVDPRQPIHSIVTGTDLVANSTAADRFYVGLLGVFGAVAVLLTAAGVYGVISYWVNQRRREIGIRLALGAHPARVRAGVVGRGVALAGIGVALGIIGTVATTHLIANGLYGIGPRDPSVIVTVAVLVSLVAAAACYLPAQRASRVDPMETLRWE